MNVYDSIIKGLNEAVEYEKENVKAKTSVISRKLPIVIPKRNTIT